MPDTPILLKIYLKLLEHTIVYSNENKRNQNKKSKVEMVSIGMKCIPQGFIICLEASCRIGSTTSLKITFLKVKNKLIFQESPAGF